MKRTFGSSRWRLLVLGWVLCFACQAAADEVVLGFAGKEGKDRVPDPWSLTTSSGKPEIVVTEDEDAGTALHVKSSKASFFLTNSSQEIDASRFKALRWKWKAVTLPTGGDIRTSDQLFFSKKNKNDQALQVLLTFKNKRMLSYVWDTAAPAGTELKESNFRFNIQAIVVQSGQEKLGEWVSYSRDIADDYRRRHGGDPPPIIAVTVQSNCNHTSSKAEGFFGPITFASE